MAASSFALHISLAAWMVVLHLMGSTCSSILPALAAQEGESFLCTINAEAGDEVQELSWPRNIVPYSIDENLPGAAKRSLLSAMLRFERSSCFLFIPRLSQPQFVSFESQVTNMCCIQHVVSSSNVDTMRQSVHLKACSDDMIDSLVRALLLGPRFSAGNATSALNATLSEGNNQNTKEADSCDELCSQKIAASITTTNSTEAIYKAGNVHSPDHPNYYPYFLDCYWKITSPAGYTLRVNFHVLDIEYSINCRYDYLDVTNLNSEGDVLRYRRLCGSPALMEVNFDSQLDREVDLQTAVLLLHLHSDDTYTGKGFNLEYELLDLAWNYTDPCSLNNGGCSQMCSSDVYGNHNCSCNEGYGLSTDGSSCHDVNECASRQDNCQHKCRNTEGSFYCMCKTGYRLNYDKATCSECNIHPNASSGVIVSRHFPAPYPQMENCIWTLAPWPNHMLRMTINYLDILPSPKCRPDFLKFQEAHFRHQRRLCGHHSNIVYVLDRATTLKFHTENTNLKYSGFKLSYEQVSEDDLTPFDLEYVLVDGLYVEFQQKHWLQTG